MEIAKAKIANALTSAAQDHVVAVAHDVYDEKLGKYQEEINQNPVSPGSISEEKLTSAVIEKLNRTVAGPQGPQGEVGPQGPKGDQGNSGYQGEAGELQVVNNLTEGGETSALSAEMGKKLAKEAIELFVIVNGKPQETLEWQAEGYYEINSSASEGAVVNITVQPHTLYRCLMVECTEGDSFLYTGRNSSFMPYAFLDSEYRLLPNYGVLGTKYKNEKITAPQGSAYVVMQTLNAEWVELGSIPPKRLGKEGLEEKVNGKQDKLISGENIKTINGFSVLGEGNIEIKPDELEQKINAIESAIAGQAEESYSWDFNGYYDGVASSSVGDTINLTRTSLNDGYRALLRPCTSGEQILIYTRCGAAYPYAFLDADNKLLEHGVKGQKYIGETLVAPANTAKVIIQVQYSEWVELGSIPPKRLGKEGLEEKVEKASTAVVYSPQTLSTIQSLQTFANLHTDVGVLSNIYSHGDFIEPSLWSLGQGSSTTQLMVSNGIARITSTAFSGNSTVNISCSDLSSLKFAANKKVFFAFVCRSSIGGIPVITKNSSVNFENIYGEHSIRGGEGWDVITAQYDTTQDETFTLCRFGFEKTGANMPVGSWHEIKHLYIGVYDSDSDMTASKYSNLIRANDRWFVGDRIIPSMNLIEQSQTAILHDLVVTVGEGGDFDSISNALSYLSQYYPKYRYGGINVEVRIKSGTVITEQIYVNGADYSWITLTYEDYNPSALNYDNVCEQIANGSIVFDVSAGYNSVKVDARAWTEVTHDTRGDVVLFRAEDGGRLPKIGCVFQLLHEDAEGKGVAGVVCNRGSSCVVKTLCGFIGFKDGVIANNESSITIREGITMNCSRWGCHSRHNGEVSARSVIATGCATLGTSESASLYSDRIADLDGREAWVSSGTCAFRCQNTSRLNCNGTHIIGDSTLTTELVSTYGSIGNYASLDYVGKLKLNNAAGGIICASSNYNTDTTYTYNSISRNGIIYG